MIITEVEFEVEESDSLFYCRFMSIDKGGFGANKCIYRYGYGKHLLPCFKEYTQYIKR